MLRKQKVDRGAQTGRARVLTVKECLEKKEERKRKEQEVMTEKQRKAALRGMITFAKIVWKEFKMGTDIFECYYLYLTSGALPCNIIIMS